MKQSIFLFLFFTYSIIGVSQHSKAIITAQNGNLFQVFINAILQQNKYTSQIQIKNIKTEKNYKVEIKLLGDTSTILMNLFLIEENFTQEYTIENKTIKLSKITSNTTPSSNIKNTISLKTNPSIPILKKTVLKKDTLLTAKQHYKMPDYSGRIGCPWPIKESDLSALKLQINQQTLDDDKLDIAKEKILFMDSVCFTMEQTKSILVLMEYEETKLIFVKSIVKSIFDIDNVMKLEPAFNFKNSILEIKKALNYSPTKDN